MGKRFIQLRANTDNSRLSTIIHTFLKIDNIKILFVYFGVIQSSVYKGITLYIKYVISLMFCYMKRKNFK